MLTQALDWMNRHEPQVAQLTHLFAVVSYLRRFAKKELHLEKIMTAAVLYPTHWERLLSHFESSIIELVQQCQEMDPVVLVQPVIDATPLLKLSDDALLIHLCIALDRMYERDQGDREQVVKHLESLGSGRVLTESQVNVIWAIYRVLRLVNS